MESRTSDTHPIRVNFIDSQNFTILGRLGMTFAPGKKQADAFSGVWERDLSTDLTRLREHYGVDVLLSLIEDEELDELQISDIDEQAVKAGIRLVRFPIRDVSIPDDFGDFCETVAEMAEELRSGSRVTVHCKGGLGRAGLAAACIAIAATDGELSAVDAVKLVRSARPGTIETYEQEKFITDFEENWRWPGLSPGRQFMLYWQERSVVEHASGDAPLDVVASNQLGFVSPGDTIWVVTLNEDRELFLAGRLVVGEVVEYEEARRRMPDAGLWQAEYYAFPEAGTEEFIRPVDIGDIADELRFHGDDERLFLQEGKVNPAQMRSLRELTRPSAHLLHEAFYTFSIDADDLEPEQMLDLARQVVEMMPDDANAHYNHGVALGRNEMFAEEIEAYRKALEIDPGYFVAEFNLGNVFIRMGRYHEAIEALNRAILISNEYPPAHFMLGVAYGELERYDEAINATLGGFEIEPDDPSAHYNIGRFYYLKGDFNTACQYFDNAIDISQEQVAALYMKGRSLGNMGRIDDEIVAYETALDRYPDYIDAMFALGAAWATKTFGSSNWIEYIETGGSIELDDPKQLFYFAMSRLACGDREMAMDLLESLREMSAELAGRLEYALES